MLLFLLACAPEPEVKAETCDGGDTAAWVMSQIAFSHELDAGVSAGFDLDGEVSALGGSTGCGRADYTDPDGTPGVDNQFATILPVLETTEAQAVEPLIQAAVEDGSLLITLELGDLDAVAAPDADDTCVDFTLGRATGAPSLGTDATLEWYQTLAVDPASPRSEGGEVALEGGHLLAHGLEVALPVTILGHELNVSVRGGSLRFDMLEDGSLRGYLGGGISKAELQAIARTDNIDASVAALVLQLLDYNVDLAPDGDGACQELSITLAFTAIPVFLHDGL